MAKAKGKEARARAPQDSVPAGESPANHLEAAIGRQVRQFRQERDLTLVALAQLAGLSRGMLSKIENGMTSPSLATLSALAQALREGKRQEVAFEGHQDRAQGRMERLRRQREMRGA